MRAARSVYILIAITILLPWIVYCSKRIYRAVKKNHDKKDFIKTLVLFVMISTIILVAVIAHYNFTISYQAPLVAERAATIFNKRISGEIDLPAYIKDMQESGLATKDLVVISGNELDEANFDRLNYRLYLSEKLYEQDDGSVIVYCMHESGEVTNYSYIRLQKFGLKWIVLGHNILTIDGFEKADKESKVRFYEIR